MYATLPQQVNAGHDRNISDSTEVELDEEIERIRAEIHELTKHRKLLSSTLLSTTSAQSILEKHQSEPSPLVSSSKTHATTNIHRIAFSATGFSFKDPSSPESRPLLGIRIDICSRGGRFVKPYYVLLKRVRQDHDLLRIHRHTIPTFIPLRDMEEKWLPTMEEDDEPKSDTRQDLQRLVQGLRQELVAWHARTDAVELAREGLGLGEVGDEQEDPSAMDVFEPQPATSMGIRSVAATTLEARYVRIEWLDGRVGRLKISNNGIVEHAVVVGDDGRERRLEQALIGGSARIEDLVHRLSMTG